MSDATVTAPDPAGLDQLIDAITNLEVPLRHDLALCVLLELRDARHEIHEYASEIIRQQREIAALRHPLTVGDPLDENDHRPRWTRDLGHLYRHGQGHWHSFGGRCDSDCANSLAEWAEALGPLTICVCGGSCG